MKHTIKIPLLLAAIFFSTLSSWSYSEESFIPKPPSLNASNYILIDYVSGRVLAEKEAEKKRKKDELAKDLQSEADIAGGNTTDEGDKPKKSNWMEKIKKEQAAKAEREEKEKEERAARYRKFLDSSDDGL